ncbi:hypothetical protein GGI42DRAFT_228200 [Trichoderma sp. SZMC 28013]
MWMQRSAMQRLFYRDTSLGGRRSEIQRSWEPFSSKFSLSPATHIDVPVCDRTLYSYCTMQSPNICAGRAWLRHPPSSHPPSPGYNKPWQPSHRTPVPGTHIAAVTSTPVQMHFTGMKGNRQARGATSPGGHHTTSPPAPFVACDQCHVV